MEATVTLLNNLDMTRGWLLQWFLSQLFPASTNRKRTWLWEGAWCLGYLCILLSSWKASKIAIWGFCWRLL